MGERLREDGGADTLPPLAERYARPLGQTRDELMAAIQAARGHLTELAASLGLDVGPRVRASRLLDGGAENATLTATQIDPEQPARTQQMLAAGMAVALLALFQLNTWMLRY